MKGKSLVLAACISIGGGLFLNRVDASSNEWDKERPCWSPYNDGCIEQHCLDFARTSCVAMNKTSSFVKPNGCPVMISMHFPKVTFSNEMQDATTLRGILLYGLSKTLQDISVNDTGLVYKPHSSNDELNVLVVDLAIRFQNSSTTHCDFLINEDTKSGVEYVYGIHVMSALLTEGESTGSASRYSKVNVNLLSSEVIVNGMTSSNMLLIVGLSCGCLLLLILITAVLKRQKRLAKVMAEDEAKLKELQDSRQEGMVALAELQNEVQSIRKQREATDAELRAIDTVFGGIERVVTDIPWTDLEFEKRLGHGAFGEVHLMVYKGRKVAVKLTLREHMEHEDVLQQIVQEMIFLTTIKRISNSNLVEFIGATWDEPPNVGIVLEFISGGDLDNFIHGKREAGDDGYFPDPDHSWQKNLLRLAIGICSGVRQLHYGILYGEKYVRGGDIKLEGIAKDNEYELCDYDTEMLQLARDAKQNPDAFLHRDLKPANVMITSDGHAKLVDLGEGRLKEQLEEDECMTQVGTPLYQCPEISLGLPYDESADIFSLGVVLNEMDTWLVPYSTHESYPRSNYRVTYANNGKRPFVDNTSPFKELQCLVEKCWSQDPLKRPSSAEVVYDLKAKVAPEVFAFSAKGARRVRKKRGKGQSVNIPGSVH